MQVSFEFHVVTVKLNAKLLSCRTDVTSQLLSYNLTQDHGRQEWFFVP